MTPAATLLLGAVSAAFLVGIPSSFPSSKPAASHGNRLELLTGEMERIRNPSFATKSLDPWTLEAANGTEAEVRPGAVRFPADIAAEIVIPTKPDYLHSYRDVPFFQQVNVEFQKKYRVSFWAKSDVSRAMEVLLQQSVWNYEPMGLNHLINLTPEWRFHSYEFTSALKDASHVFYPNKDLPNARFGFNIGFNSGKYWLAAVSLKEAATGKELLVDGDFRKPLADNPWELGNRIRKGVRKSITPQEPVCTISLKKAGGDPHDITLTQGGLALERYGIYELAFLARGVKGKSMMVEVTQDHSPFGSLGLKETAKLGSEWREFRYNFHVLLSSTDSAKRDSCRVIFSGFSTPPCDYEITKVSLKKVGHFYPKSGMYAIWYWRNKAPADIWKTISYIKGGQITVEWKDLASKKQPGVYDFSAIKKDLQAFAGAGRYGTIEINGNMFPDWMYENIPYYAERLHRKVQDSQGTLRWWHPNFIKEYQRLLAELANYLKGVKPDGSGPDPGALNEKQRNAITGIRMNFNGMGTEGFDPENREWPSDDDPKWIVPPKADGLGPAYDRLRSKEVYENQVVRAYKSFAPVYVFNRAEYVRTTGGSAGRTLATSDAEIRNRLSIWENGDMGIHKTGYGIEPRDDFAESLSRWFAEYSRTGKTFGYSETVHDFNYTKPPSGKTFPRRVSGSQWSYWTSLKVLDRGVSCVGIRGAELQHAQEKGAENHEHDEAYRFTAKYAGYHVSPTLSPGAWIALREGERMKGDYTFLMKRIEGDRNTPLPELPPDSAEYAHTAISCVGPQEQRFGAYARMIPANGQIRLDLDDDFAASLDDTACRIRIVYLDNSEVGQLDVVCSGGTFSKKLARSQLWKEVTFDVPYSAFHPMDADGADIVIQADIDLTLHMVEVERVQPVVLHTARSD